MGMHYNLAIIIHPHSGSVLTAIVHYVSVLPITTDWCMHSLQVSAWLHVTYYYLGNTGIISLSSSHHFRFLYHWRLNCNVCVCVCDNSSLQSQHWPTPRGLTLPSVDAMQYRVNAPSINNRSTIKNIVGFVAVFRALMMTQSVKIGCVYTSSDKRKGR